MAALEMEVAFSVLMDTRADAAVPDGTMLDSPKHTAAPDGGMPDSPNHASATDGGMPDFLKRSSELGVPVFRIKKHIHMDY